MAPSEYTRPRKLPAVLLNLKLVCSGAVELVRFFPEAPGRCRELHYGVFDYHPIMSLLVDLRLLIVKQNPDRMMQKAYQIFASGQDAGSCPWIKIRPFTSPILSGQPSRFTSTSCLTW